MKDRQGSPLYMVALGVFALTLGGLLTVAHVGMNELRGGPGIAHGFGYRGAKTEKPSMAEVLVAGGRSVASGARKFLAETFASYGPSRAASAPLASAQEPREEPRPFDPLEDFYDRNYGSGRGAGERLGGLSPGSWAGAGGSATSASAAQAPAAGGAAPKAPGAWSASAAPGERAAGGIQKPVFGGPAGGSPYQQAQARAALPSRGFALSGLERPGDLSGGSLSSGPRHGSGGGLQGMRGQAGAADLGGGEESARSGAASSYNAKMSGGASAAAAAGGAAPAASSAQKVEGGGGGGSGGSSSGDAPQSAGTDAAGTEKSSPVNLAANTQPEQGEVPFLEVVVVEKRNGRDAKFISEEDSRGRVEEAQLKAGSVSADEQPKDRTQWSRREGERRERPPDPPNFVELSEERKLELKQRVHGFLKRVENHYGAMNDVFYTPCSAGRELCREHGLTEGYLTMETQDEAELHMGLKYMKERWRRYTIGFTLPRAHGPRGADRQDGRPGPEGSR